MRYRGRLTPTAATAAALFLVAGGIVGCEQEVEEPIDDTAMAERPAVAPAGERPVPPLVDGAVEDELDEGALAELGAGATAFGDDVSGTRIVVEQGEIEEVRVGQPFVYTLTLHNEGETPVHGVALRPVQTANVRLAGMQQQGQSEQQSQDGQQGQIGQQSQDGQQGQIGQQSQDGQQGQSGQQGQVIHVGTLGAGESRQVQVRMVPQQEGPVRACLAVDYEPTVCAHLEAVKPELQIARMAPEQAFICDDITLTYAVRNIGSGETHPVVITEQLPQGLQTADGQTRVQIDLGAIGAGDEIRREVVVRASQGGQFESRAVAEAGESTIESQATSIRILDPRLELSVSGPQQEYIDRPISYTVRVSNVSDDPAPDTVVTMPIPENVERPTFSGDVQAEGNSFMLGVLAPNETREFTVTFAGVEPGMLEATARAEAYCAEAVTKTITTDVVGIAALRVETIDLVDPVPVGEETVYLVQLKNQGTAKSINVRAQADVPDGMTFVSAEGSTEVTADGGTLTFAPVQELAPGDVVEWRVTCRADEAGKRRFELNVQSDATKKVITEVEPTTLY